jgi:hypothetical protein
VSRDVRRVLEKFRQERVTVGESAVAEAGGAGATTAGWFLNQDEWGR